MKNLLTLSIVASTLLVTACTLPSLNPDPCNNNLDHAESLVESWNGMTYNIPWCWEKEESTTSEGQMLRISKPVKDSTKELWVYFYSFYPLIDGKEVLGDSVKVGPYDALKTTYKDLFNIYTISTPQTLYVQTPLLEEPDVQRVLSSIQFTTP